MHQSKEKFCKVAPTPRLLLLDLLDDLNTGGYFASTTFSGEPKDLTGNHTRFLQSGQRRQKRRVSIRDMICIRNRDDQRLFGGRLDASRQWHGAEVES